jgi:hypothetical protein
LFLETWAVLVVLIMAGREKKLELRMRTIKSSNDLEAILT